jgi:IS605 OrfB family transposase
MENEFLTLTRKIQLLIDSDDPLVIKEAKEKIYKWHRICFKAANQIMTHQFVQDQVKDFFYFTEDTKVKLADFKKEDTGILISSKINTTYRVLSNHFKGDIPTNILSNLNNTLISTFNTEKKEYQSGERSLRNYKRDIPLPFGPEVLSKFTRTVDNKNFSFKLFQIPFRTYLGKDTNDKKVLLERFLQGKIKMRTSAIQLNKGKVFLLGSFQIEKIQTQLDISIIAEASLSIEIPISVKIGSEVYYIGNKEEFLYRRLAIQSARQRVQKSTAYNKGGKGRKKKLKSIDQYRDMEKRYVESKLHLYSRRLIDLCLKHQAATLILINQEQKEEEAKEEPFLLSNWSYYSLKEKIAYKADKVGISVIVE